ncbi:MAG TPA: hypothetical protein VHG91_12210, partial [Longimicrobium sp.]|nr:hypothetical protein [Longimicrobium sp.]
SPAAAPRDTIPRDTIRFPAATPAPAPRDTLPRRRPPAAPTDTARPIPARRDTIRFGAPRTDTIPAPPAAATPAGGDTIFDAPGTRALVERVIRARGAIPPELRDYRADMSAAVYLSLRADTAEGGEIPVTVDEFVGEVRWDRSGGLEQEVQGHRVRMLAPTPYTVGSLLAAPWVIPHLYGNTIDVFSLAGSPGGRRQVSSAVHPFSWRGIDVYRYAAGDTVRVRTAQGVTTRLVPVTVRPRAGAGTEQQTVAGTFYVDVDRAAVARARFGFTEREGRFLVSETGVFFELENGLVRGEYWLPYLQRREIQVSSPLIGGAAAVRLVTALSNFDLNTGWAPPERGARLVWDLAPGDTAFRRFARSVTQEAGEFDISDFGDLRAAVRPPAAGAGPVRVALRYERSDHLFRYNRVEGAYLGLALRAEPRDPDRRDWDAYATAGWATAEGTARGEASVRWHPVPALPEAPRWSVALTGYRRLRETQVFRPPLQWELGYSLGAALGGYDVRDYHDATGGELQLLRRRGPLLLRLGGRYEAHDSVSVNTGRSLFGDARDFPLLAAVEPGTHAAVEGEARWARGSGAFGVNRSLVASLRGEAGFGDFQVGRVIGLLSARFPGRYVTLIGRGDAGVVTGEAPPQLLFRFGGVEGLRGYDRNAFGGSRVALGRGRALLHLPPYSQQPLARVAGFLVPPLRPAIVGSVDAGWAEVSDDAAPALARLESTVTDGVRWSYGAGLSLFEDALSLEYVWPGDGGKGRWYVGFVSSF